MGREKSFKEQAKELVAQMTLEEKVLQLCHDAPAIERLGIKQYNWWNEGLHGSARCGVATVFPMPIAMASSFNPDLLKKVGEVISDEVRAKYNEFRKQGFTDIYQGLTIFAPMINIVRDPRWGRSQESYGEDPYLMGRMATSFIKGMQGDGKYRKVDTTLKHFAAHSGPENGRLQWNSEVSDKDFDETYSWAFKYCIDNANPSAVMPAYNAFRGTPCCASGFLLTEVLRDRFGFEGIVVSDAGAVEHDFKNFDTGCESLMEFSAKSLEAGCDISIGDEGMGFGYKQLVKAVEKGYITEDVITTACERVFEDRVRLGMFADDCEYDNISYDCVDSLENQRINYEMSEESVILLKNDGILPLKQGTKIAVIGPNADEKHVLLGNYYGYPSHYSTYLNGIRKKSKGKVLFARGVTPEGALEYENDTPMYEAVFAAEKSDVVVMFMGLNPVIESEECDFKGDRQEIEIPPNQMELYEKVKATGKPIIFVNISGSCVGLSRQDKECNAVLQCFYGGAEAGDAFAKILFGECSPSGRLPVTFYNKGSDLPPMTDYSMENRTYKFFKGKPCYEFGHGLTYSKITESWINENTVEITNEGPFDTKYSVLKFEYVPHKNLVGFEKIFIKVGEKKKVVFE